MAAVFEPFFTTKEVGKGSGLGLSMVYGFIEQSGGVVRVYSEVGVGTTVRLYLPVAKADDFEPATEADDSPTSDHEHGGRILVVEDQDDVRDMAVGLLDDLGYDVVEASSPADALAILERDSTFDLLFTDIVMPGDLDGSDLADAVRQRNPDLKVLFTSGYAEQAVFGRGDFDENDQLLGKPYRAEELAEAVVKALGRK